MKKRDRRCCVRDFEVPSVLTQFENCKDMHCKKMNKRKSDNRSTTTTTPLQRHVRARIQNKNRNQLLPPKPPSRNARPHHYFRTTGLGGLCLPSLPNEEALATPSLNPRPAFNLKMRRSERLVSCYDNIDAARRELFADDDE